MTPRLLLLLGGLGLFVFACQVPPGRGQAASPATTLGTAAHRDAVMTSLFCADCHPAIYAEHRQNTHGRAFFDEEARLATRGFRREDCIRCHTPRPVFETGIGMTPMQRWTNLEEGNTCMSCHGRTGYDYSRFSGGAECRVAFEPRVGTVADCATCHRIAGTPDQWSRAAHGNIAGRICIDCHMPLVQRPVAIGQPPKLVRSHVFPASSSESQLRKAYAYEAAIDGNEVVVRITNKGAGHNFPTANRQRSVESLVIVRDASGHEIARSRMTCRYPYALELEPHQMTPPRSSQIPSGKTTEHRVPLPVPDGIVETRLFFKLYRPIADTNPSLARCLEERRLPFTGITPSTKPVEPEPEVNYQAPANDLNDFLSPSGLANVARPAGTSAGAEIPVGRTAEELDLLATLLESHLPEARLRARERLAAAFPASADVLVASLARWSNESFNEAKKTFLAVGTPAVPTLVQALGHEHLYVRVHARELLALLLRADDAAAESPAGGSAASRSGPPSGRAAVLAALRPGLVMPNPLDRRSAALALGELEDSEAVPTLRQLLDDGDWDVVMAASRSLAALGDRDAVPAMSRALQRTPWSETRRELAAALARLGSGAGVQLLLNDLDNPDELQREYTFQTLFDITGKHFGYEAGAPPAERLKAIGRLQAWWTEHGADHAVRAPHTVDPKAAARVWELVETLGGGTDTHPGGDDDLAMQELLAYRDDAVPGLIEGLTFATGFADKRALVCQALGRIGDADAAPFLAATLRDPVPSVTEWACWALEGVHDPDVIPQLRSYQDRVPSLVGFDRGAGPGALADQLLARAARTRLLLGDDLARTDLVNLLVSRNLVARQIAIGALQDQFGDTRGYDAEAPEAARWAAAQRWRQ